MGLNTRNRFLSGDVKSRSILQRDNCTWLKVPGGDSRADTEPVWSPQERMGCRGGRRTEGNSETGISLFS